MPSFLDLLKTDRTKALTDVYKQHRSEFIGWACKTFGCTPDEAKDVYQNAIIILYENSVNGKLTELNSSVKTYLFAIGKNKLKELARQKNQKENFSLAAEPEWEDAVEEIPEEYLQRALLSLEKLGDPCQSLLKDFFYHKYTMAQLTKKYGYKNEDTTKNQKYKCLMRLRKIYNDLQTKAA